MRFSFVMYNTLIQEIVSLRLVITIVMYTITAQCTYHCTFWCVGGGGVNGMAYILLTKN